MTKEVNPYNNISSFIGFRTQEEREAYMDPLDQNRNWYDRASYTKFQEFEKEVIDFMKGLHENYFTFGFPVIDSSEAIIVALLAQRLRFQENSSSVVRPNFLVSKLGHLVFKKAAVLLNVEMREVELEGMGEISTIDLIKKMDKNTMGVVGITGTTEQGNYDDIGKLDKICTEAGVPLHVDAAIGGFIYPFRKNPKIPNFSTLKSAKSVNVSGHKYGYARPASGLLLFKDQEVLPKTFYPVTTSYLPGGPSDEYGITGSKPATGLIDLNYNVSTWGRQGYQEIVDMMFQRKNELVESLKSVDGKFSIYDSGDTPIFLLMGSEDYIKGLSQGLNDTGWQSSAHYSEFLKKWTMRIVVRKHFTPDYNEALVKDVKKVTASL